MKKWLIAVVGLISIMVMVAACTKPPEKVMTPEEFYRGQTVTILVPYSPGGGFDASSRLLGPFLQKEIGAKLVLIDNMPGGGGFVGTGWLYSSAPRDGSTIGMIIGEKLVFNELFNLGEPVQCKSVKEYSPIAIWGEEPGETGCVVSPDSPYKSLRDLVGSKDPLKNGTSTAFASKGISATMLGQVLNLQDYTVIVGYPGTIEVLTAVFRGELDLYAASGTSASAKPLVEAGMIKVLGAGTWERLAETPNIPCLAEVAVPGSEKWMHYSEDFGRILRFLAGPPGVPKDRVDFLAEAFKRCIANPELQQEGEKRGVEYDIAGIGTEECYAALDRFVGLPQSERDYIKATVVGYLK